MVVKIDYKKCCWKDGKCTSCRCGGACDGCIKACPFEAITRGKVVKVDPDKCTDCGACISSCKHGAISLG